MGVTVVKRLPKYGKNLQKHIQDVMPKAAAYLRSSADKKIRDGVPPANAALTKAVKQGGQTLRDTGALAASIAPHHGKDWASAGTKLRYARINQEGGVIRSRGKGLWIPAGSRTRTLMRRYGAASAGRLISAMRADGYALWRRGSAFLARKGRGSAFVLFIIKNAVRIPARPFLYIAPKDDAYLTKLIEGAVFRSLQE